MINIKKILLTITLGGFVVLTSGYNVGLSIYIPLMTILSSLSILNPIYGLLGAMISSYLFNFELMIPVVAFTIGFYLLKRLKFLRLELIVLFTCSVNFFIYNDIVITAISALSSTLLYIALSLTLNKKRTIVNYFQPFIASLLIFASLGASQITIYNINLGFIASLFSIMYLSYNRFYIYSIVVSALTSIYFFQYDYVGVLLYLAAITYFLPTTLNSIVYAGLVISAMFTNLLPIDYLTVSLLVIAINEVLMSLIYKKEDVLQTFENIYKNLTENINNEILKYVSFLEEFSKNNIYSKDYNQALDTNTTKVLRQVCSKCPNKKCFNGNRKLIIKVIRELLKGNNLDQRSQSLFNQCKSKTYLMQVTSSLLDSKVGKLSHKEATLTTQIEGFTNSLKNYVIDATQSVKIEHDNFLKIKNAITRAGLNLSLFEIKKPYLEDFVINIGIRGTSYDECKSNLENIMSKILNVNIKVNLLSEQNNSLFVSLTPDTNYDISYGFSSLAKKGLSISGDNYLVKPLNNGKFIAAISDGMGHGYNAHHESKSLINLVNKVTDLSLETSTSINIMNTLYNMQDFLDQYATLDLLEIDRVTGFGTIYKFGSTHTYIVKEKGNIIKLFNDNLPIGILDKVESNSLKIDNNDLIIMITDGIIEQIGADTKFENFIQSLTKEHAQKVAYDIINFSTTLQDNNNRDDMAVITLKVTKKVA
ncbi:SpoIIE family protein phosphatase [Mycoplasmatota bacterium WC44]